MSYRIINKVTFVSPTKTGENKTNILKLLFFLINLHFVLLNQISPYRKLNLSLTRSVYFVFLSVKMQKRLQQTKVYHTFSYFVWKETTRKPLKVTAAKAAFPSVYGMLQLASINVFYSMWWLEGIAFHESLSLLWDLSAMLLLSFKLVFRKKSVFYALSSQ